MKTNKKKCNLPKRQQLRLAQVFTRLHSINKIHARHLTYPRLTKLRRLFKNIISRVFRGKPNHHPTNYLIALLVNNSSTRTNEISYSFQFDKPLEINGIF